jgi:hypothetical protein
MRCCVVSALDQPTQMLTPMPPQRVKRLSAQLLLALPRLSRFGASL